MKVHWRGSEQLEVTCREPDHGTSPHCHVIVTTHVLVRLIPLSLLVS